MVTLKGKFRWDDKDEPFEVDMDKLSTDKVLVKYTPTTDLRFQVREVDLGAFYSPRTATARILQQRYVGSDGTSRWIDVPETTEK